jgi:hypothetical protein
MFRFITKVSLYAVFFGVIAGCAGAPGAIRSPASGETTATLQPPPSAQTPDPFKEIYSQISALRAEYAELKRKMPGESNNKSDIAEAAISQISTTKVFGLSSDSSSQDAIQAIMEGEEAKDPNVVARITKCLAQQTEENCKGIRFRKSPIGDVHWIGGTRDSKEPKSDNQTYSPIHRTAVPAAIQEGPSINISSSRNGAGAPAMLDEKISLLERLVNSQTALLNDLIDRVRQLERINGTERKKK